MSQESREGGSEAAKVPIELGRVLYQRCGVYAARLGVRPVGPSKSEDIARISHEWLIQEFEKYPGEVASYKNPQGDTCEIARRTGHPNLLGLAVIHEEVPDASSVGDWVEQYLIDQEGAIVAAERQTTVEKRVFQVEPVIGIEVAAQREDLYEPLMLTAEELAFKIDTEFRQAGPLN